MKWRRPKGDPETTEFWTRMGEERAVFEYEKEHNLVEDAPQPPPSAIRVAFNPRRGTEGAFQVLTKDGKILDEFFVAAESIMVDVSVRVERASKKAEAYKAKVEKYEVV